MKGGRQAILKTFRIYGEKRIPLSSRRPTSTSSHASRVVPKAGRRDPTGFTVSGELEMRLVFFVSPLAPPQLAKFRYRLRHFPLALCPPRRQFLLAKLVFHFPVPDVDIAFSGSLSPRLELWLPRLRTALCLHVVSISPCPLNTLGIGSRLPTTLELSLIQSLHLNISSGAVVLHT